MDLNKVMLIGNITNDIQTRSTQNGQTVATFSIATNRRWKDQSSGELKEDTQFHNIVAWGKLGEICNQYMGKGRKIFVEGRIQTRTWDDPQSGQKKYFTDIVAENVIMLDRKADGENNFQSNSTQDNNASVSSTPTESSKAPESKPTNSSEEIPTIDIDEDQEEIKVKDIPF